MTTIYLFDSINFKSAQPVVEAIHSELNSGQAERSVDLHIVSDGGYADSMWAIIDAMNEAKEDGVHVTTHASGQVSSAAAMIFIAGSERVISPNAELMLHYGTVGFHIDSATRLRVENKMVERHYARILDHIERFTELSGDALDDRMRDDSYYLTAAEAIEVGAADRTSWTW